MFGQFLPIKPRFAAYFAVVWPWFGVFWGRFRDINTCKSGYKARYRCVSGFCAENSALVEKFRVIIDERRKYLLIINKLRLKAIFSR